MGSKRRVKSGKIRVWGSKTNPAPKVEVGNNNLSNSSFLVSSYTPILFLPRQTFSFPSQARLCVSSTEEDNQKR